MHSSNSVLDRKKLDHGVYRLATLKSGLRCLNDEMSENLADSVLDNYRLWSNESGSNHIDFTYGVLYGTEKLSNKKDWHILRKISEKLENSMILLPDKQWFCKFVENGITVDVTVRTGLYWWRYLGGDL